MCCVPAKMIIEPTPTVVKNCQVIWTGGETYETCVLASGEKSSCNGSISSHTVFISCSNTNNRNHYFKINIYK